MVVSALGARRGAGIDQIHQDALDELSELIVGESLVELSLGNGVDMLVEQIEDLRVAVRVLGEAHITNPIQSIHHTGVRAVAVSLAAPGVFIIAVLRVPASPIVAMGTERIGAQYVSRSAAVEEEGIKLDGVSEWVDGGGTRSDTSSL